MNSLSEHKILNIYLVLSGIKIVVQLYKRMERTMDDIEKSFIAVEKQIATLFNKKDLNGILKFFRDDFIGFSSTRTTMLNGLPQLKKTYLYYLAQGDKVTYSIKNVKAHLYGETALTTFLWNVEIQKGKKKINVEGRASHVFILTDKWYIVHEHYSKTH